MGRQRQSMNDQQTFDHHFMSAGIANLRVTVSEIPSLRVGR
jgi:hypothetical protein